MRNAFLDLFGLTHGATDVEIKKRYRELVLQVHPDVNDSPNAEAQFRLIQKAYEYLSDESKQLDGMYSQYNQAKQTKKGDAGTSELSPEEKRAEMAKRAREFSKVAHKEAKQVEQDVFDMLTSKMPWLAVRVLSFCFVLFGAFVLIDFWLPLQGNMKKVEHKVFYELFDKKTVFFNDGTQEDVNEAAFLALGKGDSLSFEYTMMLQEFEGYRIIRITKGPIFIDGKFNLLDYYPLFPALFILPLFLLFYKKNEVKFYLLYLACFSIYPGLLLHYLLKEDKLKYLLQFFSSLF